MKKTRLQLGREYLRNEGYSEEEIAEIEYAAFEHKYDMMKEEVTLDE